MVSSVRVRVVCSQHAVFITNQPASGAHNGQPRRGGSRGLGRSRTTSGRATVGSATEGGSATHCTVRSCCSRCGVVVLLRRRSIRIGRGSRGGHVGSVSRGSRSAGSARENRAQGDGLSHGGEYVAPV